MRKSQRWFFEGVFLYVIVISIIIVFVFVAAFLLVGSCFLTTSIKCLKGDKYHL